MWPYNPILDRYMLVSCIGSDIVKILYNINMKKKTWSIWQHFLIFQLNHPSEKKKESEY